MTVRILRGDSFAVLPTLPAESVHCVVTSPPYWGLRDYKVADQLGLEATPAEYIDKMVLLFREVWRVLRKDGTMWVNMGDTYAAGQRGNVGDKSTIDGSPSAGPRIGNRSSFRRDRMERQDAPHKSAAGCKPKDLIGVPWRLALALQEDGWWLRQDIIWAKPNPMPESVRDRCTKAHEYLFLLSKSEVYHFDADAIAEPAIYANEAIYDNGENGHAGGVSHAGQGSSTRKFKKGTGVGFGHGFDATPKPRATSSSRNSGSIPSGWDTRHTDPEGRSGRYKNDGSRPWESVTRNKRSVWTIPTQPYPEAHFATFPEKLVEPCILAGCPEGGTVLDPFGGSGTVGLVADRHHRNAVLVELNPDYAAMAERRIMGEAPLFTEVTT